MQASGDMLAECWGKRDLEALLAQRSGLLAARRGPIRAEGNFCLTVDVASFMGQGEADRSLTQHVATVPGDDFGLPGTIRPSYSASGSENAIERLATYFEDQCI